MKHNRLILLIFLLSIFLLSCNYRKHNLIYVGINQYTQHMLLDSARKGLEDRLMKEGGYQINYKNANGEAGIVDQINNQFVNQKVDILVALGTPSAQSALRTLKYKKSSIPLVFGVITDPVSAGLADSIGKPGGTKTGSSDRWPYEKQVGLIKEILPEAQKIGILVNLSEDNCMSGMKIIRSEASKYNLQLYEKGITNSADIPLATASLLKDCDVFFISPSNTLFEGLNAFLSIAERNNIPVFGGEESAVKQGSLITYAPNYYEVGKLTGELVIKITKEKIKPGTIPVPIPDNADLFINKKAAQKMQIRIPAELFENAKKIYNE